MTTPDAPWEGEWTLPVAAAEAASFITTTQETKGAMMVHVVLAVRVTK